MRSSRRNVLFTLGGSIVAGSTTWFLLPGATALALILGGAVGYCIGRLPAWIGLARDFFREGLGVSNDAYSSGTDDPTKTVSPMTASEPTRPAPSAPRPKILTIACWYIIVSGVVATSIVVYMFMDLMARPNPYLVMKVSPGASIFLALLWLLADAVSAIAMLKARPWGRTLFLIALILSVAVRLVMVGHLPSAQTGVKLLLLLVLYRKDSSAFLRNDTARA